MDRLNEIDWNIESEIWKDILIQPNGRISARKEHYDITAELVAYLVSADLMNKDEIDQGREAVQQFGGVSYRLPEPVVS